MKASVRANLSFGSSPDNPDGLQLKITFDEDTQSAYGDFTCPEKFQGQPDIIHPGIISTILDEIMVKINEAMNFKTTTGELTIRFLQPAFVNQPLHLRGWFVKKNKKVIENRAEIENEIGKIVARGKGKYIEIDE
ncbi:MULTISPECIES: PaaI family thioesterase [Leptospira]|uniref:Thioesterase n=6 Tax=Leptospira santarosai TaxID=28183 RepID=A0A0G8BHT3_9LEPT|nr:MULTISPECIES: PaaI family thioesterase [Leptospira]EMO59723.1 thioesterase family protein [Leptospira santarosai str. CBC1416]ASV11448.1 PaaI family thioesterase [Leptospira santarosai]AVQ13504.1 Thioesterase family protein [Leptospira santarosai]AVV49562.1 Thioesterase family protein [Leptospira santarosai]AVV80048.1 Thioesterase family protein [Leptospira santarosai]